jgi:hypothetical protein
MMNRGAGRVLAPGVGGFLHFPQSKAAPRVLEGTDCLATKNARRAAIVYLAHRARANAVLSKT